jgi:hypothetical protein
MRPPFDTLRFGPFKTRYHVEATGAAFREALNAYLEAELMPQVEEPCESTRGALRAAYDDELHCGPNSVVRDIYRFEFAFCRPADDGSIRAELVFRPSLGTFSVRRGRPLQLVTRARREALEAGNREIHRICRSLAKGELQQADCPVCHGAPVVHDVPRQFDARCASGCFACGFHRDPEDGSFLHGHFFRK